MDEFRYLVFIDGEIDKERNVPYKTVEYALGVARYLKTENPDKRIMVEILFEGAYDG